MSREDKRQRLTTRPPETATRSRTPRSIKSRHGGINAFRPVTLLDNRVTLGATAKGRSPSKLLNSDSRAALPHFMFTKVYGAGLLVGTKFNPADNPSRDQRPDPPRCETPSWFHQGGADLQRFLTQLSSSWLEQHRVREDVPFDGCW